MKWFYLTVLALALVTLALGGWTAKAIKAAGHPLRLTSDRREETP